MDNVQLHFTDREDWRAWLQDNHENIAEVWLVFFKKHTGKPSIAYGDAVEEALCFGWIDSLIKRLDDDRYVRKFTPRTDSSKWSAANLERVHRLVESGRMTDAGLCKVPRDVSPLPPASKRPLTVPTFIAEALAENPAAQAFFDQLAPSYRRNLLHWVCSAKREDTRKRRLEEAVSLLSEGKKLGMK